MRCIGLICIALSLGFGSMNGDLSNLNDAETRGKHIYLYGSSARGTPITATLENDAEPVPGSLLACVNCHGRSGRGTREGGIIPADIRWLVLTKPYELMLPTGRKRGPYTERTLDRAITLGFDSSNNVLGSGMPRFQMSQGDLDDLIAYLKVLARDNDPGLTDELVRIGVVLPPRRMTEMHEAIESVLLAYFDEINRMGGVVGRKVELRFLDYPEDVDRRRDIVRDFLVKNEIFALAGTFIAGDELTPVFRETETPVVAGFTLYDVAGSLNPYVFYLDGGVSAQIKALAAFAARKFRTADGRAAVVYSGTGPSLQLADGFEQQCKELNLSRPARILLPPENAGNDITVGKIVQPDNDFVVLLAPPAVSLNILERTGNTNSRTVFLIPGFFAGKDILKAPEVMNGHIFVAYPATRPGLSETAGAEYKRLLGANHPSATVASEQWSALAGASILVEALKRSGHDLSRQTLISSLEGFSNFDTGFVPPVSYGPHQRVGNAQIQIFRVDLKNKNLVAEADN